MNVCESHSESRLPFTWGGFAAGFRACVPVALGVAVYGVLFGLLAKQKGIPLWAAQSMSLSIYAGASQLIVLDLWGPNLPVVSLILTTLIVNLRHVLMGAAISPWLSRCSPRQAFGSLFFMTDEAWALSLGHWAEARRRGGLSDGAYLIGAGLCEYAFWNASTLLGHVLVGGLRDPAKYGLDFAFTAVFTALLVGLKPKRREIPSLVCAGAAALLAARFLPGKWYILVGAFAGGLGAALSPAAEKEAA